MMMNDDDEYYYYRYYHTKIIIIIITAEINTSVPAGVYLFPNPRQRFAVWIWPGTIQVSRSR